MLILFFELLSYFLSRALVAQTTLCQIIVCFSVLLVTSADLRQREAVTDRCSCDGLW